MDYSYVLYLFMFTLFFRSIIRLIFPKLIDFDTYYHLILISFIRKNGTKNMMEYKRFIKPFGMNYPWMVHWILSIFPKQFDSFLERFFNPILDALFVVLLYMVTFYLTNSNEKSVMLCLLYIFTPATFSILGTGPRIKSFTPRLFGEIVGSLVLIFEYMYLETGDLLFLGLAIFLASLVYLSSKFALQAVVFINLPLILFTQNYELLSVILFGYILAMIYSRGKYFYIFKQQLLHLKWYFLENINGRMAISDRNDFKLLFSSIVTFNFKNTVKILLFKNSFSILIYKIPVIVFYFYIVLFEKEINNIDFFVFSALIIFCLSSLKWFLFIGEAERYINYILFFLLLRVVNTSSIESIVYFFIFYGCIYYVLDFFHLKNNKKKDNNENEILINWLITKKEKQNILTIPHHLGNGWRIVHDTKHNWLYGVGFCNQKDIDEINSFTLKYPILDITKAKDIIKTYKLDYIIYDKRIIKENFKDFILPDNLKEEKISENIYAIHN